MEIKAKKIANITGITMLIFTGLSIISMFLFELISPNDQLRVVFKYLYDLIAYFIKILLVYFLFSLLCNKNKLVPEVNKKKTDVLTGTFLCVWSVTAMTLLGGAYSIFLTGPVDVIPITAGMDFNEHVILVIIYIILPAIFDEIIFRGLFAREFSIYGTTAMFMFSSLIYALSKFSVLEFPFLFICGLFFCLIYYFTGSTIFVIISHLVYNTMSYVMKYYQVTTKNYANNFSRYTYIVLGIIFAISVVVLLIRSKKHVIVEREHVGSFKFFTPLMIIFIGVALATTFISYWVC